MEELLGILLWLIIGAIGIAFYLIPTIIAVKRDHASKGGVIAVNILLGWSAIGWIVALVWALSKKD